LVKPIKRYIKSKKIHTQEEEGIQEGREEVLKIDREFFSPKI